MPKNHSPAQPSRLPSAPYHVCAVVLVCHEGNGFPCPRCHSQALHQLHGPPPQVGALVLQQRGQPHQPVPAQGRVAGSRDVKRVAGTGRERPACTAPPRDSQLCTGLMQESRRLGTILVGANMQSASSQAPTAFGQESVRTSVCCYASNQEPEVGASPSTYLRCVVLTGAAGSAPFCPPGPRSTCARQNSSTAWRPRGTRTRSRHLLSTGSSTSGRYDLPHSAGRRANGITAYRQPAHVPPTCFRTPSKEDPAALSRRTQCSKNGMWTG